MAAERDDGFDPMALEALQTQLNELKARVVELEGRPQRDQADLALLEDALLDTADLFQAARLAVFGHDVRDKIRRLTDAAAVVRGRRDRRSEGKAA